MVRWGWRLFRREWRQQLLILLLIVVAVAAVVVGSAVAVNTPPPANAGFGTAHDMATFNLAPATGKPNHGSGPNSLAHAQSQIAYLERHFGQVQVIENQNLTVPGSTQTYDLRSQDPHGPFGGPMLQLLSGHYPTGANQIAITPGLASELNLHVGDTWSLGGKTVVGIVQNPQSLLDEFALVPPGQVANPTQIQVLFDTSPSNAKDVPRYVTPVGQNANNNLVNPSTIVLALATVGMLLIALVSIGGFTVLAQRRMRSLGMLESMGATDRNVRLVLESNGVIVGLVGALVGFVMGLLLWFAYRPTNEQQAHHLIGMFALPWNVILPAMILAVVATFFAASYPARAITRMPVVSALAGRPAPPRQIHRSLVPGIVALGIGFLMFSVSGASGHKGSGVVWLVPGLVALIVGIILISPFFLVLLARVGGRSPIAVRLPLRDMARYRARSGSALSAISLGIMIAVIVCVVATARYSNVFDYVGPNMASNAMNVYTPPSGPYYNPRGGPPQPTPPAPSLSAQEATVHAIASAVGAQHVIPLIQPGAGLQNPSADGRQWNGPIYVATPALLRAYGISPSSIPSNVDILSSRPGLDGSGVQLMYSGGGGGSGGSPGGGAGNGNGNQCTPNQCLAHPVVQEESQLPTGTSAPNTLITQSALNRLHLTSQNSLGGWMLLSNSAFTQSQVNSANSLAASGDLSVESKNDAPTSSEIVNWATVFGIALALGILAMSIGLIRSETASDLRTLTATGASSRTRRALTAVTAGGLAFLGALLGTLAAYVGLFGWFQTNQLEGGVSEIVNHVPWNNLFLILIAMPVAATLIGWVLAGREPVGIATRPME
jgi:putative ABC transport system permease protein